MSPFLIKVFLSFLVAGVWITTASILAERLGSKFGGLIANLPSNILVAFVFIGLTQNIGFVTEASTVVPTGMLIDAIFLFVFIIALKKGLSWAVISSLSTWFVLAYTANHFQLNNWLLMAPVYIAVTLTLFYIMEKRMHLPAHAKTKKHYTFLQLFIRALFAGGVVATSVVIAKIAGAFWAGLFSTFPAVLLTTMTILSLAQSPAFAQATGKILMLSSSNILIFAIAVYFAYPVFGLLWGTIVSFLAAFIYILALRPVISRIK